MSQPDCNVPTSTSARVLTMTATVCPLAGGLEVAPGGAGLGPSAAEEGAGGAVPTGLQAQLGGKMGLFFSPLIVLTHVSFWAEFLVGGFPDEYGGIYAGKLADTYRRRGDQISGKMSETLAGIGFCGHDRLFLRRTRKAAGQVRAM